MRTRRCASRGPSAARGVTRRIRSSSASRARRARDVGHGLEQYFDRARRAPSGSRSTQQVTTGISCESCHLGGRAHAAGAPIHFVPEGAAARPGAPGAGDVRRASGAIRRSSTRCARSATRGRRRGSPTAPRCATRARRSISPRRRAPASGAPTATIRIARRRRRARAIAACTRCHGAHADPARLARMGGTRSSLGVSREGRVDLDRDVAVAASRPLPDGPQHIAGCGDVAHRQRVEDARGVAVAAAAI